MALISQRRYVYTRARGDSRLLLRRVSPRARAPIRRVCKSTRGVYNGTMATRASPPLVVPRATSHFLREHISIENGACSVRGAVSDASAALAAYIGWEVEDWFELAGG